MGTHTKPGSREQLLAVTLYLRSVENTEDDATSTRSQIMAAAISLFARKGYAGASMRDIASSVGIKAASLYSHCPEGKKQLLELSLHDVFNRFLRYVTSDLTYDMTASEQLTSVIRAHISWQLTFGEQALAWDALVNQFGVVDALDEAALRDVLSKQRLYHNYFGSLVAETAAIRDRAEEISIAIRVMCDQAALWVKPSDPPSQARHHVTERVLWLSNELLKAAEPSHHSQNG